jgi:hypothetical protein
MFAYRPKIGGRMLDHLVFAGPDLEAAVAHVTKLTGIAPVPGGSHLGRGTANYLASLGGGAYLEVIGPDPAQPEPSGPRPFGIDNLVEPRLVTWAARTRDLEGVIASARAAGYDPGRAEAMSRKTADGELLSWRLTTSGAFDGLVPFLIDWGSTAHPSSRPLPEAGLLAFTAVHAQPARVQAALTTLGLELLIRQGPRPGLVAVLESATGAPVVLT